jgi:hypothetical protein
MAVLAGPLEDGRDVFGESDWGIRSHRHRSADEQGGNPNLGHRDLLLRTYSIPKLRGKLERHYVLFFIHLEKRRVSLGGITRHPDQAWMQQMARNSTGEGWGFLE